MRTYPLRSEQNKDSDLIRRYVVVGARRTSNIIWATLSFVGGLGFLLTGLNSRYHGTVLPGLQTETLRFFPQGLVMMFYGALALLISGYITLTILWGVGGGFNIFDKQRRTVRIFRWGFPGKYRVLDLTYALSDVCGVRLALGDGFNAQRRILLCVAGDREIPLTRVGQPLGLEEIERLASELARFLQVDLLS